MSILVENIVLVLSFSVTTTPILVENIPLFFSFNRFIINLDIVLFSIISGSVLGLAFYHAAFIIGGIVLLSGTVSQALLPKLLSGGNHKYIGENFRLLMYSAIPLVTMAIIFSKPTLFALNPIYESAFIIVIFLALKSFFVILSTFFSNVLTGIETVDMEKKPSFSKLLKSKLFFVPTIFLIQSIIYIVSLVSIIIILNSNDVPVLTLVTAWSIIAFLVQVPVTTYLWKKVSKSVVINIPTKSILKYLISSFAFAVIFYLTSDQIITYHSSIYDFLPGLILQVIICSIVYILITYVLDTKTKNLIQSIIKEIIKK